VKQAFTDVFRENDGKRLRALLKALRAKTKVRSP
jgi:hypothetical protein